MVLMSMSDNDAANVRCPWCMGSELYRSYHDLEWGVPCKNSTELFELINLEGAQAGLSWITILNKREAYRRLFKKFDPVKVARMTDLQLEKITADASIVRHKGKVFSVRSNAQALLAMQAQGEDFATFIWSFVDGKVVHNTVSSMEDVPVNTSQSEAMSKALKKRGFKFVGPTICYAFMQAAGLVNDHFVSCPRYKVVKAMR